MISNDPWDDKNQLWKCDCGFICSSWDMEADSYWGEGMEDEVWCNWICPKCYSWNQQDDWEKVNGGE